MVAEPEWNQGLPGRPGSQMPYSALSTADLALASDDTGFGTRPLAAATLPEALITSSV